MTGKLLNICARRMGDERGSVGVLVSLVLFVVMGMLMMTWNTAQVSKEKMRLQNAVDAAALAHATWQARGMNAIQNMNEEKYLALDLAITLNRIGLFAEGLADGLYVASHAPIIGIVFRIAAGIARTVGILAACTAAWASGAVVRIIGIFQTIYCWSPIAGLINAENYATYNGASCLAAAKLALINDNTPMFSFSTIPITGRYADLFRLPVETKLPGEKPWKSDGVPVIFDASPFQFLFPVYKAFDAGHSWNVEAYVSKTEKGEPRLPAPVAWLAMKVGDHIETAPLRAFCGEGSHEQVNEKPIFAIAAGQCVTGDIVPHVNSSDAPQRPLGFGAGATAKLVPVSEALKSVTKELGNSVDAFIYH